MKKANKLVALICSLAMIFTMLANFTIASAAGVGMTLELNEAQSTATTKVIDVKYSGLDAGIASFEVYINVPTSVTSIKTESKLFTSIIDNTANLADGMYNVGGISVDNVKSEDGIFATITMELGAANTSAFDVTLQDGTKMADENAVGYSLSKGDFEAASVTIPATPDSTPEVTTEPTPDTTSTPEATTEPTPEVTPTVMPTVRPRPTYEPEATATPEATTEPTPETTSIPDFPSITDGIGIELIVDEELSTDTTKVINAKYVGLPDGIASFEIYINVPTSITDIKTTSSVFTSVIDNTANLADGKYNVGGISVDNVKTDDGVFATITMELGTPITEDTVITLQDGTKMADENAKGYSLSKGEIPAAYAVLRAPAPATPVPGTPEPTGTPAPTEKPIVGTPVKVTDVVDTDKAAEYEAQEDVSAVYVSVVVTDTEGNELEYGEDYVVKDAEGNILTQNEFNGLIGGHLGNVSEALDGLSIVAYRDDVKVNAQLIAEKADGSQELVDVKDEVVADPSTTPTTAPSTQYKFTKWTKTGSSSSITSDSITRGYSRTYVANFNNFDEDTQYIKYEITSGDRYIDLVELADTTKINVEASTVGTARIKATLYDEATDKALAESTTLSISVKSATSSSGSSSSSGSGSTGGSSIGQIAGGNLGNVSITDPGIVNGNVNFQDLDQAAWARDAIVYLAQRGIINGRSSTEFAPNDSITRAEFAQLVINMYGLNKITSANVNVTSNFADVQSGTWYYNAVNIAANLGIVNGYPDGNFYPNNLVSRQEMALMMYRVANKANAKLTAVNEQKVWSDPVADWAADAVTTLQMAGVINGTSDTTFEAEAGATRAQAAQMIYNLYQVIK